MKWHQKTKIEWAEAKSKIAKLAKSTNRLILENSAVACKGWMIRAQHLVDAGEHAIPITGTHDPKTLFRVRGDWR